MDCTRPMSSSRYDNISKSGATAFVAALIYVSVSRAAAIKCLSCSTAARPRDCEYVQECGAHEKCSVQSILTTSGYAIYSVGCTDIHKCVSFGKKRAILNATDLQEIQHKNEFGAIPDEQWDQGTKDAVLCAECCDTGLCNVKGCGEEGLPADSGPICYGCEQERDPDKCNQIVLCGRDEACHLSTKIIGIDKVYKSGCIQRQSCPELGYLDPGANVLIGRRQRDVDMLTSLKRESFCNKCCTANLCNFGNCSSLVHPTNTFPPWTHPTTTQALLTPVNGGWNVWSSWNQCSVTCGHGSHYRRRVCNNPHPAHGGALCSGPSNETRLCTQQVCAADGQWSLWTTWSPCSQTCGTGGTRYRQRNCDNPPPSTGGKYCAQQSYESQACDGLDVPNVIQTTINFTKPEGSNIAIQCLVPGSTPLQQNSSIQWIAPQTAGKQFPTNVFQADDGSLDIIWLTLENTGPYFCQVITHCGTYSSARFWVNIQ